MWYLRLLGGLSLSRSTGGGLLKDEEPPRRFRAKKYALLLAYLALAPERFHRRETLCEQFWPDSEPEAARVCLRTALSSLRRLLKIDSPNSPEEPFLADGRETIRLHPHLLHCDVNLFERLIKRAEATNRTPTERRMLREKAQSLYGGPLLPESDDSWVLGERERLESLHQRILVQQPDTNVLAPKTRNKETLIPTRLPALSSRFFGRETEQQTVENWFIDDTRLVSITGIGGMGKTRFAIEVARGMARKRRFGTVIFVPLANCADADLLPESILSAIAPNTPSKDNPWQDTVMDDLLALLSEPVEAGLPTKKLLILDNLEQLLTQGSVSGVVRFIQVVLNNLPHLSLLVTSRIPIRLSGERELPLLGLDEKERSIFLLDRARSAGRPDWGNASDLALKEIGATLGGIPLAMELVACWASVLSPTQLCQQVSKHAGSLLDSPLTTDRKGVLEPARHRSLRAALEWGYAELPAETRLFFGGLATVFHAGATLSSATAILTEGKETIALLHIATLRDLSLLNISEDADETRYHLLTVIREWAVEKFPLPQDHLPYICNRHTKYFLDFVDREATRVGTSESSQAFQCLETEEENILAALDSAIAGPMLPVALDRIRRLRWCWFIRGRHMAQAVSRRILQRCWEEQKESLQETAPEQYRDLAKTVAPLLTDLEAHPILTDLLSFYSSINDVGACVNICEQIASRAHADNNPAQTDEWFARAVSYIEPQQDTFGLGVILANWAGVCTERGSHEQAYTLLLRCRDIGLQQGDKGRGGLAKIGIALAGYEIKWGDPAKAELLTREAVTVFGERGETWNYADALNWLGNAIFAQNGREAEAREVWEQSRLSFIQAGDYEKASSFSPPPPPSGEEKTWRRRPEGFLLGRG